jgi:hypothetical protein
MQRRLSSSQGNTLGSAVSEAMLKEPALEEATIGPASPGWRVAKLMGSAVALTSSLALAGLGFAQYGACLPHPRCVSRCQLCFAAVARAHVSSPSSVPRHGG